MILTKRQLEVLRIMRDEDEELVYERGIGYVGYSPVAARTVFALLRAMALHAEHGSEPGSFERYTINETGRNLLLEAKHDRLCRPQVALRRARHQHDEQGQHSGASRARSKNRD